MTLASAQPERISSSRPRVDQQSRSHANAVQLDIKREASLIGSEKLFSRSCGATGRFVRPSRLRRVSEVSPSNWKIGWRRVGAVCCALALCVGCKQRAVGPASATSPTPPAAARDAFSWAEVVESYSRVRDYTCLYEKQERAISNGEKQTIRFAFRKPFDVRCDWLDDRGRVDQTAVYRAGANDGRVLVRRAGPLGAMLGTLRLDPHDPLALSDSRHPITEAGIGYIVERIDRELSQHRVELHDRGTNQSEGEATDELELVANGMPLADLGGARRALVRLDRNLRLPVEVELYDDAGVLIERHRFRNLRVNTGLDDSTFTLP